VHPGGTRSDQSAWRFVQALFDLEHQVLYWSGSEGQLFETIEQAEQCVPAYALRRGCPFISVNVQV
jgi:hypothetical protein